MGERCQNWQDVGISVSPSVLLCMLQYYKVFFFKKIQSNSLSAIMSILTFQIPLETSFSGYVYVTNACSRVSCI